MSYTEVCGPQRLRIIILLELLQTQTFRKTGIEGIVVTCFTLNFFLLHRTCVGHLTASLQL